MIRAIIFDCFGVLTTDRWREFSATLTTEQHEKARYALEHGYNVGRLKTNEFLQQLQDITGRSRGELEQVFLRTDFAKNEQLLDYIARLKKTYKIGLISNVASDRIRQNILTKTEQQLFDTMLMSFEVGVAKPDPQIYQLCCERLGIAASEAVMVDDIEAYCRAAEAIGMSSVVYTDFSTFLHKLGELLAPVN